MTSGFLQSLDQYNSTFHRRSECFFLVLLFVGSECSGSLGQKLISGRGVKPLRSRCARGRETPCHASWAASAARQSRSFSAARPSSPDRKPPRQHVRRSLRNCPGRILAKKLLFSQVCAKCASDGGRLILNRGIFRLTGGIHSLVCFLGPCQFMTRHLHRLMNAMRVCHVTFKCLAP